MISHTIASKFIKLYPFDHSRNATIIGLAAGFDKNCDLISHIHKLGFAFIEVGSLTPKEHKGNKNQRIIKYGSSMINNLGLPNVGIDKALPKLQKAKPRIPIYVNIAALPYNTIQDMQNFIYKIEQYCSGIVINASCPNVEHCLQITDLIKVKSTKPLFIKLDPNLRDISIKEIVSEAINNNIKGYVLTNTLSMPDGGLSGNGLKDYSNRTIKTVNALKSEDQIIIGCGGIKTVDDVIEKVNLGSRYVEVLTSWILSMNPLYIDKLNKKYRKTIL